VTALLTNKAYGYPTRGARRRRKPTILACLHQTANANATAMQERNYANRAGSWGPSATAYIDRDGTVVRAIDPVKYAAWSQGDVAYPNTKIPTIAAAHLVATASKALGIPINRSTVVVHADINGVSRRSDPWPRATREERVKRVIDRANAILRPPIVTVAVRSGDSLSAIAAAHGLTLAALLAFPENARYRAKLEQRRATDAGPLAQPWRRVGDSGQRTGDRSARRHRLRGKDHECNQSQGDHREGHEDHDGAPARGLPGDPSRKSASAREES
jgi:LysM repeat protein